MPEADTVAAREKRVLGIFILMIGAGLILDAGCLWCGSACIAIGMGLLAWGMLLGSVRSVGAEAGPSTVPEIHS